MIMVGDKIRQTKEICGFNSRIGNIFEVTHVNNDGSIAFACDFGCGIMNHKEFEEYFERYVYVPEATRTWSKWQFRITNDDKIYKYKTDNKRVIVKTNDGKFTGRASCSPQDEFDLNIGISLCLARIELAKARRAVDELIDAM